MQEALKWIKKLEKGEQSKPKVNRMEIIKIIAEINEIENR